MREYRPSEPSSWPLRRLATLVGVRPPPAPVTRLDPTRSTYSPGALRTHMSGPGEDVLTVERLNERVAAAVDTADLGDVRVVGEVTDPNETGSAVYFTLTDGDAELDCVVWQSRYRSMEADVETGTEVVVRGGLDYWVEGGRLSLKPWSVTPVGEGDRARRIARLRSELEARGWFAAERKTEPPAYPDRVGVVTSRDGDARHDVATSVHERNPTVDVVLRHATVQGPDAPTEIAAAVASLDRVPTWTSSSSNAAAAARPISTPSTPRRSPRRSSPRRRRSSPPSATRKTTPSPATSPTSTPSRPRKPAASSRPSRRRESVWTKSTSDSRWRTTDGRAPPSTRSPAESTTPTGPPPGESCRDWPATCGRRTPGASLRRRRVDPRRAASRQETKRPSTTGVAKITTKRRALPRMTNIQESSLWSTRSGSSGSGSRVGMSMASRLGVVGGVLCSRVRTNVCLVVCSHGGAGVSLASRGNAEDHAPSRRVGPHAFGGGVVATEPTKTYWPTARVTTHGSRTRSGVLSGRPSRRGRCPRGRCPDSRGRPSPSRTLRGPRPRGRGRP